jgi:hypothetical protein
MRTKIIFTMLGILCCDAIAQAIVNSNSIVLDDIQYSIQTDKSTYSFAETVLMSYSVTNLSSQNVTFTFSGVPGWHFWAQKDGIEIWDEPQTRRPMLTELTLAPGESYLCPDWGSPLVWNLHDKTGDTVGVGAYEIIGGLYDGSSYYDYTKVSVPIEIVPEPATISFLLVALPLFRSLSQRKIQGQ